jgi:cob(I)alamin adenosyltransferase
VCVVRLVNSSLVSFFRSFPRKKETKKAKILGTFFLHHNNNNMTSLSKADDVVDDDNNNKNNTNTQEQEEMNKFKVYTKTGDDGTSSLYNMERRAKSDVVFDALGDCDETNVAIGIARVHARDFFNNDDVVDGESSSSSDGNNGRRRCFDEDVLPHLEIIQSRLLDVGSAVATPLTSEKTKDGMKERCRFDEAHVAAIESWIDEYEKELPALTNFLCPGGTKFAAFLHQARAICRRCERKVQPMVEGGDVEKSVGMYLNRLSDYLFVAARVANHRVGVEDVVYKKA